MLFNNVILNNNICYLVNNDKNALIRVFKLFQVNNEKKKLNNIFRFSKHIITALFNN